MNTPQTFSVERLRGAHRGASAVVMLGGASMIDQQFDLARLQANGMVTFLESKALTPRLLASRFVPDYFLMLSPEKCMSNGFHNWAFRSFLAGLPLERFVKTTFLPVLQDLRARFDHYFEPGHASRGAHKTYRWKRGLELKDSPLDLLRSIPQAKILAERTLLARYCPNLDAANERYLYDQEENASPFTPEAYYSVEERGDRVFVKNCSFQNSAAIALYPLLRYLGFRTVYFLGMDMSMLGSMEYSAPYTFKSMLHFRWFFTRARQAFNANYRMNRPWYLRPKYEFEALKSLIDPSRLDLVRVSTPYRYSASMPFMNSISESEFWQR